MPEYIGLTKEFYCSLFLFVLNLNKYKFAGNKPIDETKNTPSFLYSPICCCGSI